MADSFQTTRWSVVLQAGSPREPSRVEALNELAQAYWKPLYWFARRNGLSPEDAEDLIQGFFATLLEREWLNRADPNRGRLRTFLLTLLKRQLQDQRRHDQAQKRGGDAISISLDTEDGEQLLSANQGKKHADESLEAGFDRHWARTVFERSLEALHQECEAKGAGKVALFERLRPLLDGEFKGEPPDQSDGALRVALHRMRARLREILRQEVRETLLPDDDLSEEIRYLGSLL